MSQNSQILEYTKDNWITDVQALTMFGCRRLAARIYDLKEKGHVFHTKELKLHDGTRVAQYKLKRRAR